MSVKSARARSRLIASLFVVLALLLAACGGDDGDGGDESGGSDTTGGSDDTSVESEDFPSISGVPGVTDTEIRFAAFGTDSNNPLGTCVLKCYTDGIKAYFEYRNSEGGVFGRDLVLSEELDDRLSENQQRALEIVSADDTFGAFSATQIASGWADVAEAGMPLYVWNIHPAEAAKPSIFGNAGVICIDCLQRSAAYVASLAGAERVASLGYGISENSKLASQTAARSVEAFSDEIGGTEVVYTNDDLAFGLPNGIGPEVSAMKDADVDFIFASIDLNGMKTLAQELERQGMGDVPMYHPNTYDQSFVEEAGGLFEGDYVGVGFRPFEGEAAGSALDTFKEWMDETGAEILEISMVGWINADLAYQGLLAAGPEFDRAKVIEATNEMTEYTADGLIPPIDWSRQHEPPTPEDTATHGGKFDCVALVQVNDGQFEVVGDAAKPWSCWPGENREWSEPTAMNFE